jgi:hypothetical protein
MDTSSNWYGKPIALNALRLGDDNARAGLVRAALDVARIANAGNHAAQLWLAHIDNEERTVFPVPQASHREKNREVGELANNPRIHEFIEDEMNYPAVVLIGK